ncbi:MAG: hypothetical protein WKG01_37730 [Kofleriaceae bacterium]
MKLVALMFLVACGGSTPAPVTPEVTAPIEPAKPPPDTGGFRLVAPATLEYTPVDPKQPNGPALAPVSGGVGGGGSYFLRLPAGYKPGLHTHTADYHAVVVSGTPRHWLAGGELKAKPLGPGSYWFQPGKLPHGDECVGSESCILFFILSAPFDSIPAPTAKPGKADNYLLVARADVTFAPMDPAKPDGPKLGIVSGDPKTGPVAFLIEIPPGGTAGLHTHTSEYHAIVVAGAPVHWLPHEPDEGQPVTPGTYWFQPGGYVHGDRCTGSTPCVTFGMMAKPLDAKPAD